MNKRVKTIASGSKIYIPRPILKKAGIDETTPLEVIAQGEEIIIRKTARCILCGGAEEIEIYNKLPFCKECRARAAKGGDVRGNDDSR